MCLFETKAIWEGLTSDDATFLTTPKVDETGAKKGAQKSGNTIKRTYLDDIVASLGILLGFYQVVVMKIMYFDRAKTWDNFLFLFVHIILCCGLFWVNGTFLFEKHTLYFDSLKVRRQLRLCGLVFFLFTYMTYKTYVVGPKLGMVSSKTRFRKKLNALILTTLFSHSSHPYSAVSTSLRTIKVLTTPLRF